jgi:NRPS condensation-like uncharacterized protein
LTRSATASPRAAQTGPASGRFSVVEELTCCYDRPSEPANVHVEVRLDGSCDQDAFRAAVLAVLAAQPRARARRAAASSWQRSSRWEYPPVPDADPVRVASWADESDLARQRAAFLSQSPDLDRSPPVRFLLAAGPDSDRVILNAHHAVLDGLSSLGLLRAVARQYNGLAGGPTSERGSAARTDRNAGRREGRTDGLAEGVAGLAEGVAGRAEGVAGRTDGWADGSTSDGAAIRARPRLGPIARIARLPDPAVSGPRPGYGACLLTWDGMPAAASMLRSLGGSVNDLLIAAMMITIGRWNDSSGRRTGRIRITMPVGNRILESADGAWGNGSRLTAVTARVPAGVGIGDLISEVARQTRYAKAHPGPQVDLPSRALAAAPVPVAAKRQLLAAALRAAGPLFCDTSLVSNLGIVEPLRFGPEAAPEIWFSTSAHMPRGLSLGVVTVGARLGLTFRYRRELLADAAAADFAGLYLGVLSGFAGPETAR